MKPQHGCRSGSLMKGTAQSLLRMSLRVAVILIVVISAGCGRTMQSVPMPTYHRPELLYLLAEPCDELYVEINRMDGITIPKWLPEELERFLASYCSKPGGIELVVDEPIPRSEFKRHPATIVANLSMDGPPADVVSGRAAYLQLLFYNSKHLDGRRSKMPAYVDSRYPCTIFYDVGVFDLTRSEIAANLLTHELGHVLGLCKNLTHGDGAHCRNDGCLMRPTQGISVTRTLLRLPMT